MIREAMLGSREKSTIKETKVKAAAITIKVRQRVYLIMYHKEAL